MAASGYALDLVLSRRILLTVRDGGPDASGRMPDLLGVDATRVKGQVARLLRAGLIEAVPDSEGRFVQVRLTYAGHEVLGQHAKEEEWMEAQEAVTLKGWKRALAEAGSAAAQLLTYLGEAITTGN